MSDLTEIAFAFPGGINFTATHEAGVEIITQEMGFRNVADRSDGNGDPILEQEVLLKGVTLPNVIISDTENTAVNIAKAIRAGKGKVTLTWFSGRVYSIQQAIIVGDVDSNTKKSSVSLKIQGGRLSGQQS